MGRKILGKVKLPTTQQFTYVRAWQTGRILKCRNIPNQQGNFLLFGYPATNSLDILNKYWEIIPESEATYIGDPQTQTDKRKHNDHFYLNYQKRRQFQSVEDFLNR